MDERTLKASFVNVVLMANADGELAEGESAFIRSFVARAGISNAQMQTWLGEIKRGEASLQGLDDATLDDELLALMVGAAASDGALGPAERDAFLHWGRIAGLEPQALQRKARELWNTDVLADLFPPQDPAPAEARPRIYVLTDGFGDLDKMLSASPDVEIVSVGAEQPIPPEAAGCVLMYHVGETQQISIELFEGIRRQCPDAIVVAVMNRHQAFQISYLYEVGVPRCLVKPVYPGEVARVVAALTDGRATAVTRDACGSAAEE